MICTNCKKENRDDAVFCRCCVTKFKPSDLDLLDKSLYKIDWQFYLNRGIELTTARTCNEALEYFAEALKLNPNEPAIYNARGKCNQRILYCPELRFKHKEALEDFLTALKLNPDNIETLNNVGLGYQGFGKNNEAIKFFNQVLNKEPLNIDGLNNRAYSKYVMSDNKGAQKDALKVLKIIPTNSAGLYTYSRTLIYQYELKKGIAILKKLADVDYSIAKIVLKNIKPIQYLVVTEVKSKGYILTIKDNEKEAVKCHKQAFEFIDKNHSDKIYTIETGIKYVASYTVKENPTYLKDIILSAGDKDCSVSIIKFDVNKFSLKAFIKKQKKQKNTFHKLDVEDETLIEMPNSINDKKLTANIPLLI